MRNILSVYMANKKITIPVTIVVVCLIAGGIVFGVTASSNNKDNATATTSSDVKVGKKSASKNTDTKKSDAKNTAESKEKNTASSDEEKSADKNTTTADTSNNTNKALNKSDKTNASDKKPSSSANNSASAGSAANSGSSASSSASASAPSSGSTNNTTSGSSASTTTSTPAAQPATTTCSVCGEAYDVSSVHDCQYTTDYYGNVVKKNSRYVTDVGSYGTKKYSDGTYEVTDEGRNALREDYEQDKMACGDGWETIPRFASIEAYVISRSGI